MSFDNVRDECVEIDTVGNWCNISNFTTFKAIGYQIFFYLNHSWQVMKLLKTKFYPSRLVQEHSKRNAKKFKHSFQETLNLICSYSFGVESTFHYVFHCAVCNDERHTLLSTIKNIDCRLLDETETVLIKTLLFGNCSATLRSQIDIPPLPPRLIFFLKKIWPPALIRIPRLFICIYFN